MTKRKVDKARGRPRERSRATTKAITDSKEGSDGPDGSTRKNTVVVRIVEDCCFDGFDVARCIFLHSMI